MPFSRVGRVALAILLLWPHAAAAHGVARGDARFLQSLQGAAIGPLMYLGAKHMVTGYDHLLFLVGVLFFLYRLRDVLLYVSLFTIGHSVTLLAGVLGGFHANAFVVDAIIGLSVVYKAFENMGGFRWLLGWQPDTRAAVLIFGLCHGFGLATKLQEFTLPKTGLVANIVSFNVGVEIGQLLALTAVLIALTYWRLRPGCLCSAAFVTNARADDRRFLLVVAGDKLLAIVTMTRILRRVPGSGLHQGRRLAIATAIALLVAASCCSSRFCRRMRRRSSRCRQALGLLDLYRGAADPSGAATTQAPAPAVPPMTMFKVDSVVFKLRSSEGFEYKYRIEKGGGLLYTWKATRPVKYEFHGEPDGAGLGVAVSYEKSEGSRGSGSFVAPSSGIHGWYWENTTDDDMTITLTSSGFYSWADEFRQRFDPVKHKGVVDRIRHELSEPTDSR
jgi:hypothetical protein